MRRLIIAGFCCIWLAASVDIPSPAASPHVLRFTDGLDLNTLNPLLASTANVSDLSALTMAHLTKYDASGRLAPDLITEIPSSANGGISADGKTLTYHLRRGVRWSDGAPFTADDVAFTIGAINSPANNISDPGAFHDVLAAHAKDKYTVVLALKAPHATFAADIFNTATLQCILPKHLLGSLPNINTAAYNSLPVGIGPFRYTAFRRGDAVEMEANPLYFGGRPKLDKIVYKIITDDNTIFTQLQTHELDMWSTVSGNFYDRVQHIAGVRVATTHSAFVSAIHLNTQSAVTSDPAVRRALRLATDRRFLLKNVNHDLGTLAESVVAPVQIDFDPALPQIPYDPARAEGLLDAAGWKRGAGGMRAKNGVPLLVNIALPSGYAPSASTAELLRADWEKIGVAVAVKPYSSGMFFASQTGVLSRGAFDAALLSYAGSAYGNVIDTFGCEYIEPHGFNDTRYCNEALESDLHAYIATYDDKRRAAIARRLQRRIDDDAPEIVTYDRDIAYAFSTTVTGFNPTPFGSFDNILGVDVAP